MKYRALPVEVEAWTIVAIAHDCEDGSTTIRLDTGGLAVVTKHMTARMTPKVGDYYVVQSDNYVYLNPKDVFERKYAPVTDLIEPVVADDPGDAQLAKAERDDLRDRILKAEGNPVQARYTLAVEITKAERRAEHLRTLLNALPRSFWERPGAEETIREVLGK